MAGVAGFTSAANHGRPTDRPVPVASGGLPLGTYVPYVVVTRVVVADLRSVEPAATLESGHSHVWTGLSRTEDKVGVVVGVVKWTWQA